MKTARLSLLVMLGTLAACRFDESVPNARLICAMDSDCPGGGRCLATTVADDAGTTSTVKLCCAGDQCTTPTRPDADPGGDSPSADGASPEPDMDPWGDSQAPSLPGSDSAADAGSDAELLSCTTICPVQPNTMSICSGGHCRYSCESGWGVCGSPISRGGCNTMFTTAANCGTCGRSCDCNTEGRCAPEIIAVKARGEHELLRNSGAYDPKEKFLYFIDLTGDGIQRIGLDGKTQAVTDTPLFWPALPRLAGDHLYWAEGTEMQKIRRMRLADVPAHGPIEDLVTGLISPGNDMYQLAIIDQYLYWMVGSNLGSDLRVVQRRRIDGGAIEMLLPTPEKIDNLAFAPGGIFWDVDCCGLRIRRAPLAGGAPSDFVAKPPDTKDVRIRLLGTDAHHVYWNNAVPLGGSIWRVPQDATPETAPELLVAKLPREYPEDTGISFDAEGEPYIHWLYGDIARVVRSGQHSYNVAFPATPLVGVAVDTTHVYWLDDKGTFGRAPK